MSLQPTTHGRGLPSHVTPFEEAFTEFEPDAVIVGVINCTDVMQDANREHIRVGLQRSPEAIDDLDELRFLLVRPLCGVLGRIRWALQCVATRGWPMPCFAK